MEVRIKKAICAKKTITYEKKSDRWAQKCDYCGKIFRMDKYCNDLLAPAILSGIFSECADNEGNMFLATVCSFACAEKMFKGGWKNMPDYKPFKKINAYLVRVQLGLTSLIKTEEVLIKEWEDI